MTRSSSTIDAITFGARFSCLLFASAMAFKGLRAAVPTDAMTVFKNCDLLLGVPACCEYATVTGKKNKAGKDKKVLIL